MTLEPCNHTGRTPPCADAVIAAGIARVVAAMADPNPPAARGAERLRAAGIAVDIGLLEDEARELNIGFVLARDARPAVGADEGRGEPRRPHALADGESQWITGEAARADGHRWRARACAILTGIGTVRQDDPQLTVRAVATPRQPLRVVVDRHAADAAGRARCWRAATRWSSPPARAIRPGRRASRCSRCPTPPAASTSPR